MVFQFPTSVLVSFPKLVALALRKTNGLLREISDASIMSISSDMKEVGIIIDKFGRPTVNLSCDETDENYRNFFAPLQYDSAKVLNMDDGILNVDGFPVLQLASHLLPAVTVSDGRHRILSSNKAFGDTIYDTFVLCSITKFKDPTEMKLDSYKKSAVRPVVYDSIHDALECINVLPERALNLQALKKKVVKDLKLSKQVHIDRFCKLLLHMFPRAKKLMDLHRDATIFSQECIFGSQGNSFVVLMQETGRVQLRSHRYGLCQVLCDLETKEELQIKCILLSSWLSRKHSALREKPKVLACVPKLLLDALKEMVPTKQKLELSQIPALYAGILKGVQKQFNSEYEDTQLIEILKAVFPENPDAVEHFLEEESSSPKEKRCFSSSSSSVHVTAVRQTELLVSDTQKNVASENSLNGIASELDNELSEKTSELLGIVSDVEGNDDQESSGPQKPNKSDPSVVFGRPYKRCSSRNAFVHELVEEIVTGCFGGGSAKNTEQISSGKENVVFQAEAVKPFSRHDGYVSQPNEPIVIDGDDLEEDTAFDKVSEASDGPEESAIESPSQPASDKSIALAVSEVKPEGTEDKPVTSVRRSKRIQTKCDAKIDEDVSSLKRKANETTQEGPRKKKPRKSKVYKRRLNAKHRSIIRGKPKEFESEKAACGMKCLELASNILSRVVFIRLERNEVAFSRFQQLPNQGPESIVFFDNRFVTTGKTPLAIKKMSEITAKLKYIVCMTDTEVDVIADSASHMSIVSSGVLKTETEYETSNVFVKVYALNKHEWKGPQRFQTFYNQSIKVEQQICNFLLGSWHLFDLNLNSCTIFDFMLDFQDLLQYPLAVGFQGFYFKCVTKEQENSLLSTQCLDLLRNHVLKSCVCGGHALLTADNEPTINRYEGALHDCDGLEKQPFFLPSGAEDVCPFGRVITHTSLLLRKDVQNNVPTFVNDVEALCTSESNPETGFPLHRGAFLSKECAEALSKEDVACDILFPKCFLIDTLSKIRHYENSLSPFEMRELYVSGITYRKLWLFFSNRSTASFFNEGNNGGEIDFTPRYMDSDFICTLYRKGFGSLVEEKMSLICCTLKPKEVARISKRLICSTCGAIEVLTDYGQEYVHD